ncbi:MAG: hypothetical protein KAZ28_00065 [Bacteroidaceae bacterium]|nr:hypothetical protein [Bacteroidaceae bacterium]
MFRLYAASSGIRKRSPQRFSTEIPPTQVEISIETEHDLCIFDGYRPLQRERRTSDDFDAGDKAAFRGREIIVRVKQDNKTGKTGIHK